METTTNFKFPNATDSSMTTIIVCHNVEVHKADNSFGSVISDAICCFVNLFMCIISTSSNALVIYIYIKSPLGKTIANFLLLSLTVTETIKCTLVQPAFFIWKAMQVAKLDFCYPYLFTITANHFCTLSSFLHTCFLITIERYLSVFKPILHRKPIVKRSFQIAATATQLGAACFLLTLFLTKQHRLYFISISLLIIICFTVTAVTYFMIQRKMKKPITNKSKVCGAPR